MGGGAWLSRAAVLPVVKKPHLLERAAEIAEALRRGGVAVDEDATGTIGKPDRPLARLSSGR